MHLDRLLHLQRHLGRRQDQTHRLRGCSCHLTGTTLSPHRSRRHQGSRCIRKMPAGTSRQDWLTSALMAHFSAEIEFARDKRHPQYCCCCLITVLRISYPSPCPDLVTLRIIQHSIAS